MFHPWAKGWGVEMWDCFILCSDGEAVGLFHFSSISIFSLFPPQTLLPAKILAHRLKFGNELPALL